MEFSYFAVFTGTQTCMKQIKKSAVMLRIPPKRKQNSEALAVEQHSSQKHC